MKKEIWFGELNKVENNLKFQGGFLMMELEINLKKSFGELFINIKYYRFLPLPSMGKKLTTNIC